MRKVFILISVLFLAGCANHLIDDIDFDATKKIGNEEVDRLPKSLTYGQLIKHWGPAVKGPYWYLYQSKVKGITLNVFVVSGATASHFDDRIVSMYFSDARHFSQRAWGRDIADVNEELISPIDWK